MAGFEAVFDGIAGVDVDRVVLVQFGRPTGVEWRFGGVARLPNEWRVGEGSLREPDDPRADGDSLEYRDWLIKDLTEVPRRPQECFEGTVDDLPPV